MIALLNFLARHAMAAMVGGVFIGLLVPPLASLLNPLLAPSVWILLVVSMLRIDPANALAHLRHPFRISVALIWLLAVTPVLMWAVLEGIGDTMVLSAGLAGAMVMAAGSSPLMSAPAIGVMMRLDGPLILALLLAGTMLMPLTLPVVALQLLGIELDMGVGEMMARLGALIGSAMLTALAFRRVLGTARVAAMGISLDGANVIVLVVFAVAIMDGITARLLAEPEYVVFATVLTFAVYVGLMMVTLPVCALLMPAAESGDRRRYVLSTAFTTGCRNLGVILAILPKDVDADMILYFAVGQFPIYLMPAILKPVILRLLRETPISNDEST